MICDQYLQYLSFTSQAPIQVYGLEEVYDYDIFSAANKNIALEKVEKELKHFQVIDSY